MDSATAAALSSLMAADPEMQLQALLRGDGLYGSSALGTGSGSAAAAAAASLDSLSRGGRRGQRLDPRAIDWEKVTGEENVSVFNRYTGKRVSDTYSS